jgi:hypothetical protein
MTIRADRIVAAFVAQWWIAGLVLFYLSVKTAYLGGAHGAHVVALGVFEAAAALLFLVPRTMRIGAVALLATFALVFLVQALQLQFRGDLLVYAAAVGFVAVHGPVPALRQEAKP